MTQYKIPVTWEMMGYVYVEAENLGDAIVLAESDETDLPADGGDYVDGSWEVDAELTEFWNSDSESWSATDNE